MTLYSKISFVKEMNYAQIILDCMHFVQRRGKSPITRTPVLFEAVCRPNFTKISNDVRSPSYFLTPFFDYLCHVLFSR